MELIMFHPLFYVFTGFILSLLCVRKNITGKVAEILLIVSMFAIIAGLTIFFSDVLIFEIHPVIDFALIASLALTVSFGLLHILIKIDRR